MILDTSGVLVFLDASARDRSIVQKLIDEERGPLLLSPFVLAEIDYLVTSRFGAASARGFLGDVAAGAYELVSMSSDDVRAACAVLDRYRDLDVDLADASSVVIAERYGDDDILTLDQRHFRAMTRGDGRPFRLLPADA
ncbi:MAG: DNA-binding protein [Pseudonocardia sp.]